MSNHDDFVKYPTGKIPKGSFCDVCKKYNSRYVACCVIVIEDNKILLVKRANEPKKGDWSLPGGYFSWDETTEQCAARELREETGYIAKNIKFFTQKSDPNRDDGRQNLDLIFSANVEQRDSKFDREQEIQEVKWFNVNNLPSNIIFDHPKIIKEYLDSKK